MLLSIDTSAGASVAVVDAGRVLGLADEFDTRSHAEAIGRLIQDALAQAAATPADITAVVAGMGPGPFTGLRVGIAAAHAFAAGRGIPTLPLASHDAVAWERATPALIVTDARRREVAWSAYAGLDADGLPVLTTGPHLAHPEDLETVVEGYMVLDRIDAAAISAASLGLVADRMRELGRPFPIDRPLYLRAPDVTLSAGPKSTAQKSPAQKRGTG
ncbi:MAG: tRNA (adenosine(37)-N6)-threonylcarbamoyltransferase complex dimerization subunit type 1 TsaB [Pseudolysinimonas sp.]